MKKIKLLTVLILVLCAAISLTVFSACSLYNIYKYLDSNIESSQSVDKGTESLSYSLNSNGTYTVTGIGTVTDTDIVIPSTYNDCFVTSIGERAFYNCSGLTSVEIPDSVTSIGESAFSYCSKITRIIIPDSVTSIGERAFSYCNKIKGITIPDSVTSIGKGAFYNCRDLKRLSYDGDIAGWCNISFGNYFANPLSYAHNLYLIKNGEDELVTDLVIPDGVTSIGSYVFKDCSDLKSVVIPDSVTSIGDYAFYNCGLKSIVIPDSVTSIGDYAFYYCGYLKSVVIPDSVTSIGERVFCNCSGLTSVVIPDSVTSIGDYAFYNCECLTSVVIPDSVTSIGCAAFRYCGLTSVTFENTNGWYRATSSTVTSGTSVDVTDASQNAADFKSTCCDCYWKRS